MFDITISDSNRICLAGRFHAAHVEEAQAVFSSVTESCEVSLASLDYISSAGLTVLLETQKRLMADGHSLTLVEMPPPIRNVFQIAGFDAVFAIR